MILSLNEVVENIDKFLKELILKFYNNPVMWILIILGGVLLFAILYRSMHKENR